MEEYDDFQGYEDLANAVIVQAVEDYLYIRKELYTLRNQDDSRARTRELKEELERIRKFFRSDWYIVLSDIDGETLIHKLDNMHEEWKKELVTAS